MRQLYIFSLLLFWLAAPLSARFEIRSTYGDLSRCDTMSRGIFLVWWDKQFDHRRDADRLLDSLMAYRAACIGDLGMQDPPNPGKGYFYNLYIHHPGEQRDLFAPKNWAAGQGTDENGLPFVTLPAPQVNDWLMIAHETFHIFQYSANSPGFAYSGNSQWYIEGSASWFAARRNRGAPEALVVAEAMRHVPQVPLWLSYGNFPQGYPQNWQRYVHQYGTSVLLYYLTEVAGYDTRLITRGFYAETELLPQEYLFQHIGGDHFRILFLDWAVRMVNDFDFLEAAQKERVAQEWNFYADKEDGRAFGGYRYVRVCDAEGTRGWVRPAAEQVTTGWSFNTFKLRNPEMASYYFELKGDETGDQGSASCFRAKVLVQNRDHGFKMYDVPMEDARNGGGYLNVSPGDTAVYLVIASMPDTFADSQAEFQRFSYETRIYKMD